MLQSIHSFFLFCFHYSLFLPSRTSRILFWSLPLLRGSVITGMQRHCAVSVFGIFGIPCFIRYESLLPHCLFRSLFLI
uniref:Uncharacterized protein n=1 Tax=Gossypium raimondii TaxID=29730 RepID=A0A0D2Q0A7_GOSRA|nr:hypothetical protein B456_005G269300 [Gossypium raimondii]